jgi:hypothetical protein
MSARKVCTQGLHARSARWSKQSNQSPAIRRRGARERSWARAHSRRYGIPRRDPGAARQHARANRPPGASIVETATLIIAKDAARAAGLTFKHTAEFPEDADLLARISAKSAAKQRRRSESQHQHKRKHLSRPLLRRLPGSTPQSGDLLMTKTASEAPSSAHVLRLAEIDRPAISDGDHDTREPSPASPTEKQGTQ